MDLPTGPVPESYQIYLDQFDSDPDGTLKKLENHVSKRNSSAVGYYILAILSRKAGRPDAALRYALSAKIMAPGSKFFKRFPYYIQHADFFDAWIPEPGSSSAYQPTTPAADSSHPIRDLDQLITKLSLVEKKRIRVEEDHNKSEDPIDLSKRSAEVDDIVTETLALIHEKQGNYKSAIKVYKQLRQTKSYNREHYDEQILRLNDKLENDPSSRQK
ncbi:MAG: hypothetical protein R6V27_05195 [Balneolaceae bacterium]